MVRLAPPTVADTRCPLIFPADIVVTQLEYVISARFYLGVYKNNQCFLPRTWFFRLRSTIALLFEQQLTGERTACLVRRRPQALPAEPFLPDVDCVRNLSVPSCSQTTYKHRCASSHFVV